MLAIRPAGWLPQNFFAVLAVLFGLTLAVITPPFQAPDEPAHLLRIWQLSELHLLPDRYGGSIPASLGDCFNTFLPLSFHPENRINVKAILQEFRRPLAPSQRQFIQFPGTAIYSPVPYLPQVIASCIGRVFSLPPIGLMYLGRCANALAYAAIGWLAIRMLPVLQWPACLMLLAPLPIFLAGSLSADPITTSLNFLATASILRLTVSSSPAPRRLIGLVAISLVSTALCKWTYFTGIFLLVAVPLSAWGFGRSRIAVPICIVLCVVIAVMSWSIASSPMHVPLRNGDPRPQLHWIESHPAGYLQTICRTIRADGESVAFSSIGVLGWLDTILWWPWIAAYLAVILWTVLNDSGTPRISITVRFAAAAAALTSTLLITTCVYLVWDTTGSAIIEGLQGRYFVPLALLVFLVIRRSGAWKIKPGILQAMILLSCLYTVWAVVRRYY